MTFMKFLILDSLVLSFLLIIIFINLELYSHPDLPVFPVPSLKKSQAQTLTRPIREANLDQYMLNNKDRFESCAKSGKCDNIIELAQPAFYFLYARKGKVLERFGKPIQGLPKNWEKHFMLGFSRGSPLFEKKTGYLFKRSLTHDQFLKKLNHIQFISPENEKLAYFAFQNNGRQFLFFLRLDHSDVIDLSNRTKRQAMSGSDGSIWKNLGQKAPLLLVLPILLFFLPLPLLHRYLERRFLMRFLIFILFSALVLNTLALLFIRSAFQFSKQEALKNGQLETSRLWRDFEFSLQPKIQQHAMEIHEKIQKEKKLKKLPLPSGSQLALIDVDGVQKYYPRPPSYFFEKLITVAAPTLLASHENCPISSAADIQARHKLKPNYSEPEIRYLSENDLKVLGGYLNTKPIIGFKQFNVARRTLHTYYDLYPHSDQFTILVGIIPIDKIHERFMREWLNSHQDFPPESHAKITLRDGRSFFSPRAKEFFNQKPEIPGYRSFHTSRRDLPGIKFHLSFKESELFSIRNMELRRNRRNLSLAWLGLLVLSILYSGLLQQRIQKLRKSISELLRIESPPTTSIYGLDEFANLHRAIQDLGVELEDRKRLSPFVAEKLVELFSLESGELKEFIEDEAVVLFSDIRSFTTISETYTPETIVSMLNDYFSLWQEAVHKNDGIVERFIGDAIVVLFFRSEIENFKQNAVECALKFREMLGDFNRERHMAGDFQIEMGVGLSLGRIQFSTIGDETKRHFFSSGAAIQQAEELEAFSKIGNSSKVFLNQELKTELSSMYDFEEFKEQGENYYEIRI